jgi:hypothetical protein
MKYLLCTQCGCSGGYSASDGDTCSCGGLLFSTQEAPARQILARVTLPKRPVQIAASAHAADGTFRERFDAALHAVRSVNVSSDVRDLALELMEGFRSRVVPQLHDLEQNMRTVKGEPEHRLGDFLFEGLDEKGRVHVRLKSTASDVDLYIGANRHVEVLFRGTFQIPERGDVTPESLVGAVFGKGPTGEA